MAGDFAFSKQKDYSSRNFGDFALVFGSSFLNGVLNKVKYETPFSNKLLRAIGGYYIEYMTSVMANGYNPYDYGDKGKIKASKFSLKAFLTSWKLRITL